MQWEAVKAEFAVTPNRVNGHIPAIFRSDELFFAIEHHAVFP